MSQTSWDQARQQGRVDYEVSNDGHGRLNISGKPTYTMWLCYFDEGEEQRVKLCVGGLSGLFVIVVGLPKRAGGWPKSIYLSTSHQDF